MYSSNQLMVCVHRCRQLAASGHYYRPILANSYSHKLNSIKTFTRHDHQVIRQFFRLPFKPFKGQTNISKVKKYSERRVLGYSKEQLYEVVSLVDDYHLFLPACVKSHVFERRNGFLLAELEIGVPPIIWERYTSQVTLRKPNSVIARCNDGKLFNYLETHWTFGDGLPHIKQSCCLDFRISFEFKSLIHSQLSHAFFDEMVHKTVNAFLKRAEQLYGKQCFIPNASSLTQKTMS
ncbi:coenzyme Q-binding protein COQ10 homolog B, mitochondrial-like [Oppia nitens]|uniref:coenzyme Q-binding protein COQ10 homolog B, mitochondrial-like n=1 Tax=Oppia nitens TaxID=1686743 RepID=UPI0023DC25B5|nr:coenzyme Q-binding protein COQ10 homolog B, mitochondrial-like [Oppia nitens]